MGYKMILLLLMVVFDRGSGAAKCNHDGELIPNSEDCRKYFKCAQGAPSVQSCPGTLIFDPLLKICNWPESTTCIADLKPKIPIREKTVLQSSGGLTEDDLKEKVKEPELTPEEEQKRKEAIASLFHVRDRKTNPFTRRRHRPRNSLTTTTERNTARQKTFANRGSQVFSTRTSTSVSSSISENSESSNPRFRFRNGGGPRQQDEQSEDDISDLSSSEERQEDREKFDKQKIKEKILRDLLGDQNEFEAAAKPAEKPKPKSQPIKCHTGASNELYPNPRNCRKYYKCESGGPSLQSCPANLIFDTSLKICNWPDATNCVEDPTAELPEVFSSDRHPPKNRSPSINTINTDKFTDDDFLAPAVSSLPSPSHGSVPSFREAMEREELLKQQYPLFDKVKKTVKTLDTDLVEKIEPGSPTNPDNVQRVEFILSQENYEDLFPRRHNSYTYKRLLQAIGKFPAICSYVGREEDSDRICRKTLATMFAHFTQETGNHNPSDADYEEWRQGLSVVRELGCTDTSPGCGYNSNCEDKDSITKKWACGQEKSGKFKKYYGRGAKQLSYNFNYGQFSQAMFDDGRLLLDFPDFVATTWLNLASATWFYTTPQPPKPSMLHVIDGTWVPNQVDRRNGIEPGFGATINIINGGLECNTKDGRESKQALNRIAYYKQFAWYLYVDYENESLGCAKQKQFSAGGAGALPIYWDKDWSAPYSCKLVNYQTAHSALVPGEYIDCIEENFDVKIRE